MGGKSLTGRRMPVAGYGRTPTRVRMRNTNDGRWRKKVRCNNEKAVSDEMSYYRFFGLLAVEEKIKGQNRGTVKKTGRMA
jgi:hypothetical protein